MDKDPLANREFAELTKRFHFFVHDSKNNQTEVTEEYEFGYIRIGFLVLDCRRQEFGRIEEVSSFHFDTETISQIEVIEQRYLDEQRFLADYLNSMLKTSAIDRSEMSSLVEQLASNKYLIRENAEQRLLSMGNCSRLFLSETKTSQPEARGRIDRILKHFMPLEKTITRYELEHNIPFLAKHSSTYPNFEYRLKQILPFVVPDEAAPWWNEHGDQYEWDPIADRFVGSSKPPIENVP